MLSAFGDLYLYKLSHVLNGGHVAQWAVSFYLMPFIYSFFKVNLPSIFSNYHKHISCMLYLILSQLFAQLTNWFMFYCITRTLSNSLETVLTVISLYYWPCLRINSSNKSPVSRTWALVAAAIACAIRPTSAIIWIYVGVMELYASSSRLKFVFLEVVPIG